MSAVINALRARSKRLRKDAEIQEDDPYNCLTSRFPAEQDRVFDFVLGQLMLDG